MAIRRCGPKGGTAKRCSDAFELYRKGLRCTVDGLDWKERKKRPERRGSAGTGGRDESAARGGRDERGHVVTGQGRLVRVGASVGAALVPLRDDGLSSEREGEWREQNGVRGGTPSDGGRGAGGRVKYGVGRVTRGGGGGELGTEVGVGWHGIRDRRSRGRDGSGDRV